MVENAITKVARIAAHSLQGLFYKDSSGTIHKIPTDDKNYGDITGVIGSGTDGGDTGGGDNPDHPSSGADYYAGSLADGEITERKLLWQGSTDPTKTNNLTLLEDVGSKFNMAGDGAMYLVHIQKTAMTAGVKGATSDLQLNYDPSNAAKDGYFTTTSVYPIYISSSDLSTHQELVVPINGIGENLGGKNTKAPELHVTFKDDKTMDISTVTGYCNDGADSGATGANYDIIVEVISTFSTQKAVAQLPASINLFTGSASGSIALSGASDFYENSMDGIEITLDDYLYSTTAAYGRLMARTPLANVGIDKVFRIPKEYLIFGYHYDFHPIDSPKLLQHAQLEGVSGIKGWTDSKFADISFESYSNPKLVISSQNISLDFVVMGKNSGTITNNNYVPKVLKVTPYKK
ncbi:hypothetical protein CPR19088_GLDEOEPO_01331 [Companilactobacillus paralimentarius]